VAEKLTLTDLLAVDPEDPGCDAGFEIIAQYVELELAGEDAAARFPGLAAHLRSCPGCRIDHDGILEAARSEQ
jgi:hypothetical protein